MSARVLVVFALLLLAGCDEMRDRGRIKPLEPSTFFENGQSARPLVEGTIARGHLPDLKLSGAGHHGVTEFPMPLTRELLERGRTQYSINCTPCHGIDGYGRGMIVLRGLSAPPSFHEPRLRAAPVGHYFNVITNGYGAMYPYGYKISPEERWAVIAYIRALQLSQNAPLDAAPPDEQKKLQEAAHD
ncbi:MAG TPA: cytochrome c [Planctomycetota bacterium]|nr:cytochrome c [Planctomycetota bacterium]